MVPTGSTLLDFNNQSEFCRFFKPTSFKCVQFFGRYPWEELESDYARHFKSHGRGEIALNVRIAIGALLVKEFLGLSDRGVVEAVSENPYLQYFLGFKSFQTTPPFNASLMTHFRKRFPAEVINRFNGKIIELGRADRDPDDDPPPDDGGAASSKDGEEENSGTILMDATCAPADIKYPTDLNLVNDARELSEAIIVSGHPKCTTNGHLKMHHL